jgi:hypothetical protein
MVGVIAGREVHASSIHRCGQHRCAASGRTYCRNRARAGEGVSTAKLSAVGAYQQCLIRVYKRLSGSDRSMRALARCDERFDQAFGRAEADDACRTPGGASAIRNRIADDLETIVENLTATTHFEQLVISPGDVAVCLVDKTASAIDLAVVIGELRGFGVTQDTAFWIQAWGGDGSRGNVESHAGAGGRGGYAQMTTSLSAFRSAYRTREFHYYLGSTGPLPMMLVEMAGRPRCSP